MPNKISEEKKQEILRLADGTRTHKEIGALVGVSEGTVNRYAKGRGITREEYARRIAPRNVAISAAARNSKRQARIEYIRAMGYETTASDIMAALGVCSSTASELRKEAFGACSLTERTARSKKAINESLKRERTRIAWGLPQKTRRKFGSDMQATQYRYRLRKRGYVFFPDEPRVAYYDQQTSRSAKMEANAAKHHFTFKELDE